MNKPPKIAHWIISRLSEYERRFSFEGDLEEIFGYKAKNIGLRQAKQWYWIQAIKAVFLYWHFVHRENFAMLGNYLKATLRNIKRHKGHSLINIIGLAVGLTCSFLIMIYIQYELSFDRYHENENEIYRIVMFQKGNKLRGTEWFNSTPGTLKTAVPEAFSEVLKSTRAAPDEGIINHNGNLIRETGFRYADPEFLEIFSFPLLFGNQQTALSEPFSLLLTEEMAEKYFGNENPMDKVLNISDHDYKITGVLKSIPKNSHFTFDFLASFNTYNKIFNNPSFIDSWNSSSNWNTYILTVKNVNSIELEEKITDLLKKHRDNAEGDKFHLQSLTSIHLQSKVNGDAPNVSDIRYVYLFSAIGLLIMLIACLNYINLTTARSAKRAKEIGVRKIVGAYRSNLIKQFLGESILFILFASMISFILSYLIIPSFGDFIERDLNINMMEYGWMILGLFGALILVGLLSGIYPAIFLSAFRPVNIIRGTVKSGSNSSGFRSVLVVIQFVISVILVICSLIIYKQLEYIGNANIGFKKDHIIYGIVDGYIRRSFQPFKDEIEKNPNITDVYALGDMPISMPLNAYPDWEGKNEGEEIYFYFGRVDYNFIDFFELEILKGRDFSKNLGTDVSEAWILNETAAEAIGWENPIGKSFSGVPNPQGKVIGVVKDFHHTSLHHRVQPVALCLTKPERPRSYYAVKVKSENISGTIDNIKEKFKKFSPDYPFRYFFLDESVNSMYQSEQKLGDILYFFTFIAIFISCLGLFGLVSNTAEQKTKEIGIRKVLGASVSEILFQLSKEFIRWVLVANLIAWPVSYFVMNRWLQNFAYRANLGPDTFIFSALLALVIALLTVSYQSIKAATANPVDSLRYE